MIEGSGGRIPGVLVVLLVLGSAGCGDAAPPIVANWKLDLRGGVGYPIEIMSNECTVSLGERLDIHDETSGEQILYEERHDCPTAGRDEITDPFFIVPGDDGLYGIVIGSQETLTCDLDGDELECSGVLSPSDLYVRD